MSVEGSGAVIAVDHDRLAELAAGILEAGHTLRFTAPGSSMYPFIKPGALIDVHPLRQPGPRPMDILLYLRSGGRLAAHRLTGVVQEASGIKLVLRGDAPPYRDELIETSQVLGQVVACEHAGRRRQLDSPLLRGLGWLWVASSPLSYYALNFWVLCRNALRRWLGFFFRDGR